MRDTEEQERALHAFVVKRREVHCQAQLPGGGEGLARRAAQGRSGAFVRMVQWQYGCFTAYE